MTHQDFKQEDILPQVFKTFIRRHWTQIRTYKYFIFRIFLFFPELNFYIIYIIYKICIIIRILGNYEKVMNFWGRRHTCRFWSTDNLLIFFYRKNKWKFRYIVRARKAIKNFTTEKLKFNLIYQRNIHIIHQIVSANQWVKIFE